MSVGRCPLKMLAYDGRLVITAVLQVGLTHLVADEDV